MEWISHPTFEHGKSEARDADQLFRRIENSNFPDLGATPQVYGTGGAFNYSFLHTPQMVRIYLDPHHKKPFQVYATRAGGAAQRLRQYHGCSTMQQPERLSGPVVYRHRRFQIIRAYFREGDAQVAHHIGMSPLCQAVKGDGGFPKGWCTRFSLGQGYQGS